MEINKITCKKCRRKVKEKDEHVIGDIKKKGERIIIYSCKQ